MDLWGELRRRNVLRTAGLYLVSAWLLVQVGATLLPVFEAPPWVMKSLVGVLAAGFVPALIVAWIVPWTPTGLLRDAEVAEDGALAPQTARRMDRAIIVVLLLALGYFVLDKFVLTPAGSVPAGEAAGRSGDLVAVLPFRNRSRDGDDALLVEGIHDDLLTQLSKVDGLKVISRNSMLHYAGTTLPATRIARELGAAVVLDGSVQRQGDQIRITVQLTDGATDVHLWAERYDRQVSTDTIFTVQADVAQAIASAMKVVLTPAQAQALATGSTSNLEAYEAFVQGKLLAVLDHATHDRIEAALRQFDRAIELDPDFADAYARKTRAQLTSYWYAFGGSAMRDQARDTLAQARRLAPDATETLMAQAYMHYWGERDYDSAEAVLARVLERTPDYAEAWYARALVARRDGRFDDSIVALRRSLAIDPINTDTMLELSNTLATLGRHDEAAPLFARSVALGAQAAYNDPAQALLRGEIEAAWRAVEGPNEFFPALPFLVAIATRDPARIELSLSPALWPERLRTVPEYPETYELARAEGLQAMGRDDEADAALRAIKARMDLLDTPYPGGWSSGGPYNYFPSQLPGLMRDLDGVRQAELDFLENAPKDAWTELAIRSALASAFARAGDPGRALHHLEAYAAMAGPGGFAGIVHLPALDPLRELPRFRALQDAHARWLAAGQGPADVPRVSSGTD